MLASLQQGPLACRFHFCLSCQHYDDFFRLTELKGGLLTKMLIEATRTDPIAPILHKKHIEAINRRMPLIFSTLSKCVSQNGMDAVIVDNWSGLPRENT